MPITRHASRRLSVLVSLVIAAGSLVLVAPPASAVSPGPLVYSVNPWENGSVDGERGFQPFDAFTGDHIGGAQIEVVGGAIPMSTVDAASGIAIDPLSGTAYVLLKGGFGDTQLPRVLATLDLSNGEATTLGNTTKALTNLAFGNGTLYGVGGRSGNYSGVGTDPAFGHLFSVSTANGSITADLGQLTNCPGIGTFESCGHAIAFNSDDGELYHMSGPTGSQVFERVVLTPSFAVEPLTFTSTLTPDMVLGMGWDSANDRFIMTDWNTSQNNATPDVFSVTVNGSDQASAFALPKVYQGMKGLAVSTDPVPTDVPPTAVDDSATATEGDGYISIDVMTNDTDPDAGPQRIESVSQPANGSASFSNFNGSEVFYSPEYGYCNDGSPPDTFTYTLNGGSTATVSVTIDCVTFEGPLAFAVYESGNSEGDGALRTFDAGTGLIESTTVISLAFGSAITGSVNGATALAMDPRTRTFYAALDMNSTDFSVLATIDPITGEATTIGDTGLEIGALTVSADGTLYGFTQYFDNTCAGCLFVLNETTGTSKLLRENLASGDYAGMAFNPLDRKIYVATSSIFLSIDPSHSFAVTDIGYGGDGPSNVYGMGFDATLGGFVVTDDDPEIWRIATNGGAIQGAEVPDYLRGIVVSEPLLSLKYTASARRFSGTFVTPGVGACDDGRTVSVWRDVTGPDELVGTGTTDAAGAFALKKRAKRGGYFATVDPAPAEGDLPCPDGRSKTIKVR